MLRTAVAIVSLLASGALAGEPVRVRDEGCGVEVWIPDATWTLRDESAGGVAVHVYSPSPTLVPRATILRLPAARLPDGLRTRVAQIEADPLVTRVRLEPATLGGHDGERYEYVAGGQRVIEVGARVGTAWVILQLAVPGSDAKDEARAARFRRFFAEARFLAAATALPAVKIAGPAPDEIRAARKLLLAPPPRRFAVREHDLAIDLWPAEGRLHAVDDLLVEGLRGTTRSLRLVLTHVEAKGARRTDARHVLVDLDRPLGKGGKRRIRVETESAAYRYSLDQELIGEVAIQGQVNATSSYSVDVWYHPADAENDATARIAITVPEGGVAKDWVAVAGGEPAGIEKADGRRVFRYVWSHRGPRAMPFGFAAARYARRSGRTKSGLVLDVYHLDGSADAARRCLADAVEAATFLEGLYGPLPWRRVAICQVKPERKEEGVSLPGLILLSDAFFGAGDDTPAVADELSHQWNYYAVALPNELSEGISTFTNELYREARDGPEAYRGGVGGLADSYHSVVERHEEVAPADPAIYSSKVYRVVAFCRTAVVLDLLRSRLGDETFFRAWPAAFAALRGRRADYDEFAAALGKAAGVDLGPFFTRWFFTPGHPRLAVTWRCPRAGGPLRITLEQTQPGAPYALALPVEVRGKGGAARHVLRVGKRTETFALPAKDAVDACVVDPDRTVPIVRSSVREAE